MDVNKIREVTWRGEIGLQIVCYRKEVELIDDDISSKIENIQNRYKEPKKLLFFGANLF